jgi:hypothetical protein
MNLMYCTANAIKSCRWPSMDCWLMSDKPMVKQCKWRSSQICYPRQVSRHPVGADRGVTCDAEVIVFMRKSLPELGPALILTSIIIINLMILPLFGNGKKFDLGQANPELCAY